MSSWTFARALRLSLRVLLPSILLAPQAAFAAPTPEESVQLLREPNRVILRNANFDFPSGPPPAPPDLAIASADLEACRFWIVKYSRLRAQEVRRKLVERGCRVFSYVPNSAFLVRARRDVLRALREEGVLVWMGPYRADYKISPEIGKTTFTDPDRPALPGERLLVLSAFEEEDLEAIAAQAVALGAEILGINRNKRTPRILVRVRDSGERPLALIEGIEWIEEAGEITLRNNTTRWVVQSNSPGDTSVWDHGLHGEGQVIGHIDGPIQRASCYFLDPIDNTPGPNHRKLVAYRGTIAAEGHGTHTAATSAGFNVDGTLVNAGHAYMAKISHTRLSLISGFGNGPSNLYSYLQAAHDDGARVHTNSWGDDNFTSYTTWARDIDSYSRDFEDDLVLFAVTNTSTLKTPENAKNCVAVGASQQAPNQHTIGSGGRGPTSDGRRKPEIFAPGIGIVSASIATCNVSSLSGTSMACPTIAAYAALIRQYYEDGFHPTGIADVNSAFDPSAALVKATLLGSTADMTGVAGYPTDREGWGRLLLESGLYFAGGDRRLFVRDVRHSSGLSTGELDEHVVSVSPSKALRVTMVFTDQPAALGALLTPVNDLDLEVEGPDGLFLGNVFANGHSAAGGSPDNLNNVERVTLPRDSFSPGLWTIRVRGASVPDGPQGYAIHASGALEQSVDPTGVDLGPLLPSSGELLGQNNPNPFSSTTTIQFTVPKAGEVTLTVFDIAGRHIQTLAEGPLEVGEYTVSWDARDFIGERVAAGIYFYHLEGAGLDETRKLVVLR